MRAGILAAGIVVAMLGGCASQPEDVQPLFYSTDRYVAASCDELTAARQNLTVRETRLHDLVKQQADDDNSDAAVKTMVLWPSLYFFGGGVARDTAEYSLVKGEIQAVDEVRKQKDCDKAAPSA